ncbi:MAG: cyclic nucleotide-binding domain-containing protein [Pseudomonadales bacterium]|nr:cyclic nucleotide-binding domain-containing protein [Pseudomonadales bacterium]
MAVPETVLIVVAFLMLGVVMAALFRKVPIPYTVMLVLLGVLLQWLSDNFAAFEILHEFTLTSDIILFVFLPALVFEAGLGIPARQLRKDIAPILMLAIPALFISSFLVAFGLSSIAGLPFIIALLFGALISATDPVAVIGLFKELGAPKRLTVLVEGESLFNDATAIVMFNLVLGIVLVGTFELTEVGPSILEFFTVFLGGALVGIILGLIVSSLMNALKIAQVGTLIVTLSLAYLAFIIAEHQLHVSGVMAVTFAALTSSLLVVPRLQENDLHSLHSAWEFLSSICNTLLFLLIGLSISISNLPSILGLLFITILLVQLARASVVYSLVPLAVRLFRLPIVTRGEQHIMWWGGLKGGLAIAMVLLIPDTVSEKQLLIDLTAGVVIFTLLVNAPSIRVLINKLGIDKLNAYQQTEFDLGIQRAEASIDASLQELTSNNMISGEQQVELATALKQSIAETNAAAAASDLMHNWQLRTLGWEISELDRLYREGVIPNTAYVDIHYDRVSMIDYVARNPGALSDLAHGRRHSSLKKLDRYLVKTFREKDWAAAALSKYLRLRLQAYLTNTVINLHLYRTVALRIENSSEMSDAIRAELDKFYAVRRDRFQHRLDDVRNEFPVAYEDFESGFAIRASLASALHATDIAHVQGELSDKTFNLITRKLRTVMDEAGFRKARDEDKTLEYVRAVTLFTELPDAALHTIVYHTHGVSYLSGDIIIGEGEAGNALYILIDGEAQAIEIDSDPPEVLGTLVSGDFFGEMALLGENIRSANVEARTSCVLLRISHKAIWKVAAKYPQLHKTLERVREARTLTNIEHGIR